MFLKSRQEWIELKVTETNQEKLTSPSICTEDTRSSGSKTAVIVIQMNLVDEIRIGRHVEYRRVLETVRKKIRRKWYNTTATASHSQIGFFPLLELEAYVGGSRNRIFSI